MSHDPDRKIQLPKGTGFKNLLIGSCLYKRYPQQGKYAGGIVFHRCYGVGSGVGFTKEECEKMWGDVKLDDHVMLVHGDDGTPNAAPTATTTTTPNAAPTATPNAAPTDNVKPGDCIEVWWEDNDKWYPGVVTDEAPGAGDTSSSQIAYDDEKQRY